MTVSIAHEVNQPLSGIVTNASTCSRMLAAAPPNVDGARETALRMIRDVNRAADVIKRLRALFTKKGSAEEHEHGRVRLSVEDNGRGLEPESLAQLFDAFYTTKSGGMGIGLSVSRSIIENHHGTLWGAPCGDEQAMDAAEPAGIPTDVSPEPTHARSS